MKKSITTTISHDEIIASIDKATHLVGTIDSDGSISCMVSIGGAANVEVEEATVTPTTSPQVITPSDDGIYLSQVTVNAVPYSEEQSVGDGITVTIGDGEESTGKSGVSKVIYYGEVLTDLSDTTATSDVVGDGYFFYGANGEKVYGTVLDGDSLSYGINTVPIAGIGQSDYMVLGDGDNATNIIGYATVGSTRL